MRISDWSSDVCSSDLRAAILLAAAPLAVPYAFNYDLTTVTAAAMLAAIRFRGRIGPFLVGAGVAVCLLPGAVIVLNAARLPLGPLLLAAFVLALLAALEGDRRAGQRPITPRSEEHTSELQSLMRISYAVFRLKKNKQIDHQS